MTLKNPVTIGNLYSGRVAEGWQNWDMLGLMQQIQGNDMAATYIGAPA
ncbi:MAG TPA: hypothetical protein VK687_00310 [Bryobacteraceae bacterium]|nr:hypothetical protein [Bryobacteraceae bacterium]